MEKPFEAVSQGHIIRFSRFQPQSKHTSLVSAAKPARTHTLSLTHTHTHTRVSAASGTECGHESKRNNKTATTAAASSRFFSYLHSGCRRWLAPRRSRRGSCICTSCLADDIHRRDHRCHRLHRAAAVGIVFLYLKGRKLSRRAVFAHCRAFFSCFLAWWRSCRRTEKNPR